jgi:hypothetical protein
MRLKRFLAALLSVALMAPPGAFAQSHVAPKIALNALPTESPLISGPADAYADPLVPPVRQCRSEQQLARADRHPATARPR